MMEMPKCDGHNFQLFLDQFSEQKPHEFKIMVLDNGAFHKAKTLQVPKNIALLFLPPYSPELNPAEKMWARFKRAFTNKLFKTLDQLSEFIYQTTSRVDPKEIITTCSYKYVFNSFWTKS